MMEDEGVALRRLVETGMALALQEDRFDWLEW